MDLSSTSLRTKPLILRAFAPADAPDSYAAQTTTLTRYMAWDPAPSPEQFEQIWPTLLPTMVAGTDASFVVRLAASQEFLGMAGLHHIRRL
jgi:RimJ/RimL family protein N-acetyltransferase